MCITILDGKAARHYTLYIAEDYIFTKEAIMLYHE